MSHANQSQASDVVTATRDSLRTEAEELRRQIGSENMNQSGVIASRRLDEALLRLDLAAGRRRETGSSISSTRVKISQPKSSPRRPRSIHSAPASDLELDDSIAQSSSVWLEPTEQQATRYRLDPAPQKVGPPTSHIKPLERAEPIQESRPVQESRPIQEPRPIEPATADSSGPRSESAVAETPRKKGDSDSQASFNAFADLFATPIDVMVSSQTANPSETEHEQIITSVPESRREPSDEVPEPTEEIGQDDIQNETCKLDDLGITSATPPELEIETEPVTESIVVESDLVKPTPEVTEPVTLVDEVIEKVTGEVTQQSTDEVTQKFADEATSSTHVEEPVDSTPPTELAKELRPFQATWQVDEFIVPSTVDELFLAGSVAEQLAARLAAARSDGLHTIAVTSPKSGEGRSTVAMGMALSVAFTGLRVALVDADPKGVKLATDLQLDLENSWIDAIRTDLPLEEAAVFSQADSLTLIPLLESDAELPMNVNELRRLLGQLKETFDLVIVDCGASAVSEVTLCDTALIVRDVHRTKALEVETLAMSLRRNGLQGIGVVENFCPQ